MPRKDFTHVKNFPGLHGNAFDLIIFALDRIAILSDAVFAVLLLLYSLLVGRGDWMLTIWVSGFVCTDWLLLALLPRFKKSFGPAKPPVLMLAVMRAPFFFLPFTLMLPAQVTGVLLVIYGFWIEPHTIKVTRQKLVTPKLRPTQTLRLLHLGDIHLERITHREEQLIQLCRDLKPDLILFSGDFLNLSYLKDDFAQQQVRQVIAQISAPLGVYCVKGSPAVDRDDLVPGPLLQNVAWQYLADEMINIESHGLKIQVLGLACTHKPFIDAPKIIKYQSSISSVFTILLYHAPDLIYEASEVGIDLQLSGHTHGGQVRLPLFGALVTGSLYGKEFEAGRYQVGGTTLYVTRGIGLEGAGAPRVRFGCAPEIILWEIQGKA